MVSIRIHFVCKHYISSYSSIKFNEYALKCMPSHFLIHVINTLLDSAQLIYSKLQIPLGYSFSDQNVYGDFVKGMFIV